MFADLLVADHWLYVTECNLQRRKKTLSKRPVSLYSMCKRRLNCKRQVGAALTLANGDKINENVEANVGNKRNYDGAFNRDIDMQVQQGHHYLLDISEPTVW